MASLLYERTIFRLHTGARSSVLELDSINYFIIPFMLAPGFWTQVLTRPGDPNDTRSIRDIIQLPCYICGTDVWSGMVNCFQCGNPIIYEEEVVPSFRDDITGLPASCVAAIDADTLF